MIKKCSCQHSYQDQQYGKGNRVHTEAKDGTLRCTVCGPKTRKTMRLYYHALEWAKPQR